MCASLAVGVCAACGLGNAAKAERDNVSATDTVLERNSAGSVISQRELRLDTDGNWIRHGQWRRWDDRGQLMESGQYDNNRRTGRWTKWLGPKQAGLLVPPETGFAAPLISQADFLADRLHGEWVIFDAGGRHVFRGEFHHGDRHGELTWWDGQGRVAWRQSYRRGRPEGPRLTRDRISGETAVAGEYLDGYRVERVAPGTPRGEARADGQLLVGPELPIHGDDFANSRFARYQLQHEVLKHGAWRQWNSAGQLVMQGQFDRGQARGRFEWRHANGQLAAAGDFEAGQYSGEWRWWDPAGVQTASRDAPVAAISARPAAVK